MSSQLPSTRRYISKRKVGERYGVTPRTIERWIKQNVIPPPNLTINNRHYWYEDALERHDRQLVAQKLREGAA